MSAYMIFSLVEVLDPEPLGEYREKFGSTLEKYGGRRLASDPDFKVLEGSWDSARTVIIEFPDMDALNRWHESDEYKPLIAIRQKAARGNMIAVAGL